MARDRQFKGFKGFTMRIVWFCLDGVRIDVVKTTKDIKDTFLYNLMTNSYSFFNMDTCCCFSSGSMSSAFTSMYPWKTGVIGYGIDYLQQFNNNLPNIVNKLKDFGFKNYRWCGMTKTLGSGLDEHQVVPNKFFDVWEHPKSDKVFKFFCFDRKTVIDMFNNDNHKDKFMYLHLTMSHELPSFMSYMTENFCYWDENLYKASIKLAFDEFEYIYKMFNFTEEDLVIISTDHGIRLNVNLIEDCKKNGILLREPSVKIFCSFVNPKLKKQVNENMVSNLDIVPTILGFINQPTIGIGKNLLLDYSGNEYNVLSTCSVYETQNKKINVVGIKDKQYKYIKHFKRGSFLFDYRKNEDDNLINTDIEKTEQIIKLKNKLEEDLGGFQWI